MKKRSHDLQRYAAEQTEVTCFMSYTIRIRVLSRVEYNLFYTVTRVLDGRNAFERLLV